MQADTEETGAVFFWRPNHPTLGFLSQWYASPFHGGDKAIIFQTAEHFMMYQKALLFSDPKIAAEILATPASNPRRVRELGRQVSGFDQEVWEKNREQIVQEGSYHKFMHSLADGEDLKAMLLKTGDRELVEASPRDRIWGIGFGEVNAPHNRRKWGLNLLGKSLMIVRQKIMEEEQVEEA